MLGVTRNLPGPSFIDQRSSLLEKMRIPMGEAQIGPTKKLFSTDVVGGKWRLFCRYPIMRRLQRCRFHSFYPSRAEVICWQSSRLLTLRVYGSYPRMVSYKNLNPRSVIRRVDLVGLPQFHHRRKTFIFWPKKIVRGSIVDFFEKNSFWVKTISR